MTRRYTTLLTATVLAALALPSSPVAAEDLPPVPDLTGTDIPALVVAADPATDATDPATADPQVPSPASTAGVYRFDNAPIYDMASFDRGTVLHRGLVPDPVYAYCWGDDEYGTEWYFHYNATLDVYGWSSEYELDVPGYLSYCYR